MGSDDDLELCTFEVVTTKAGVHATPAEVDFGAALAVSAPATVASAWARAGRLDLDAPPAFDAQDHWFRARVPENIPAGPHVLVCEGLATLADVWIDGAHVLASENMFVRHEVALTQVVQPGSEFVFRFRAVTAELAKRRPRPRWRTRIVDAQQLRWLRTSLIGRTPGFCPSVPVVGPYRPVRLVSRPKFQVRHAQIRAYPQGVGGRVDIDLKLACAHDTPSQVVEAWVLGDAGEGHRVLPAEMRDGTLHVAGSIELSQVARWWPHTHGESPRSQVTLRFASGDSLALGAVGFRELRVERDHDGQGFGLIVNGESIFARGACWTTDDLLTLSADNARKTLELARAAGMNMLRIGGTTAYESDAFYELCDELGILVFQDFMFANMDYPVSDPSFAAEVEREVREVLGRLSQRPCLAVLCGGSEVEQQVAMLGLEPELQQSPLFYALLPRLCEEFAPQVPYVSSSPFGGDLPFSVNAGISHYYGVGAYLRPLDDARRAKVRFAAECLAFANVPCRETVESFMRDLEMPFHHPRWKQRVPRDRGVGWDFEDVRDHYLAELYRVVPTTLRYTDPERYLLLSQAVVGEVMRATFDEWRSTDSSCRGALVFWLKDFWSGAGWGVIDARGLPKSAYYGLKRALQPVSLALTDEGLNGVMLHVVHECAQPLEAELRVRLFRAGEIQVAEGKLALALKARSTTRVSVERVLGRFVDSAYAYRFGPAGHDVLVAELRDTSEGGTVLARAFHFPQGHARSLELDIGLSAQVETRAGKLGVCLQTKRFAQSVSFDVPGFVPEDDWFHVEPGGKLWVGLVPQGSPRAAVRGEVVALNAQLRTTIKLAAATETCP